MQRMILRMRRAGEQRGSAMVIAMLALLIILPLGLALLAIVDTQASESGRERTRDRSFNLADSALSSAAYSMSRNWPTTPATAPSNAAIGTAAQCGSAPYGAVLGAAATPGSSAARLQPNLNGTYLNATGTNDPAFVGASWQVTVCDDNPAAPAPKVWDDSLLTRFNYDQNANNLLWVRASSVVNGRRRQLVSLVSVANVSALPTKYGLQAGQINSDVQNAAGSLLGGGLLGGLTSSLLGPTNSLVKADPGFVTNPPTSGVTAIRCGLTNLSANPPATCLSGVVGATSAVPALSTLLSDKKLEQATSPTAATPAAAAQLKQQAIASQTYVASTPGTAYPAVQPSAIVTFNPVACTIPATATAATVVYIEKVGNGDDACLVDVKTAKRYKALVIGSGRVVVRGDNTSSPATSSPGVANTRNVLQTNLYALNLQRLSSPPGDVNPREIIRLDQGAHVLGSVSADGRSGLVGIYPPEPCRVLVSGVSSVNAACELTLNGVLGVVGSLLGLAQTNLDAYNPAVQADVATISAAAVFGDASLVAGTYRDLRGSLR